MLIVGTGGVLLGTSTVWSKSAGFTGNEYLGLPGLARDGYVLGFLNGVAVGAVVASDPTSVDNIMKCLRSGLTAGQLEAVLDKNLADHPETRNRGLSTLTMGALTDICRNVPGVNMTP
ncbi:MAG TPA: hypothetical protein VKW09_12830 [bacterium]|nr:hypothetical protein [bacterium]